MSLAFHCFQSTFHGRESIIKSSADFGVMNTVIKGGRKEVAEKDEEAKIKKKKSRRHPPRRNSAPVSASGSARYLP